MTDNNKVDLNQTINIVRTKVCSIKPFKGADESKNINLKIRFDNVPLDGIVERPLVRR